MPRYGFIAIDDRGREYRAVDEAMSEAALEGRLRKAGHWVAKAWEIRPMLQKGGLFGGSIRVPTRPLTEFFLQLSMQLKAGIPVLTALSGEAGESPHPGLKRVVQDLSERVQSGQTLSEAMAAHPKAFPRVVVNLTKAGEASGNLAETCNRIRLYMEWQERIMADMRQALTYPAFVLVCALAFVFIVFTLLIPRFAKLLAELNVPLPLLTQIMMRTSDFFVHNWAGVLGGVAATWAGLHFGTRLSPGFALLVDRAKLKIPVIGGLWCMIGMARFAQNLGVMYGAGIALPEALGMVAGLTGNRVLEKSITELRQAVTEGRQMHSVMGSHPIFSKLVSQMIAVGETTGSLATALENVSDYYNEVLPRQIKRMFSLLEPLMIVGLVGFVGMVALSIFLPIVSLLNIR
ncbi:MAG TPA: hypothetical protein DCM86_14035 [Verrucomicrobiales bacterium]|nr:hypothetical protein [Verrucomicrobiales bacterium]